MSSIKPLYSGIKLNVAITSDNHLDISTKTNKKRMKILRKSLIDIQNSTVPFDAYVTVGDMTTRGIIENWECVKECFKGLSPAKHLIFALGNHDSWDENRYLGYDNSIGNFYKYSKEICNNEIDKPYFSKEINGYTFICLGSTKMPENEDCAAFGEAELDWLKTELEKASLKGKPIFLFSHQTVNQMHGLPKTWDEKETSEDPEVGGIGGESDAVKEIISAYKNIFYFSGHSHMGICGDEFAKKSGYSSFEKHDGVNYVNLPCLTRPNHHGETEKTGWGYLLEVYDNKVVIRPRNYVHKKMNKKIIIQNNKPYFETEI